MLSRFKKNLKIPGVDLLYKIGLNPNHVTIIGLFIAFIAVFQEYYLGLVLFTVSFLMDLFDGSLARKYKLSSKFGGVLDSVSDKIIEMLFIYFLVVKLSVQTMGVLSVGLSIMISYVKHRSSLSLSSFFDRGERIIFLLIIALFFNNKLSDVIFGFNLYNAMCVFAIIQLMVKVKNKFNEVD